MRDVPIGFFKQILSRPWYFCVLLKVLRAAMFAHAGESLCYPNMFLKDSIRTHKAPLKFGVERANPGRNETHCWPFQRLGSFGQLWAAACAREVAVTHPSMPILLSATLVLCGSDTLQSAAEMQLSAEMAGDNTPLLPSLKGRRVLITGALLFLNSIAGHGA